jgi:phage shock protein E
MTLKLVLFVVVALAAVIWFFSSRGDVSGAEARKLVGNGALLLDVRTQEEFALRHIEGALNIPVQQLDRRIGELGTKDRPVVVYCRSGRRSAHAARMLQEAGYTSVHDLGGMNRW